MRLNLQAPEIDKIRDAIKADPVVVNLVGMRHSEIDSWVDANITTIADVRGVLKRLIKLFIFLIKNFKIQ